MLHLRFMNCARLYKLLVLNSQESWQSPAYCDSLENCLGVKTYGGSNPSLSEFYIGIDRVCYLLI